MLKRILSMIEADGDGLDLQQLSRDLSVERSALAGMLDTLVRLGRLKVEPSGAPTCAPETSLCTSCAHITGCPFAGKKLNTYTLEDPGSSRP